MAFDLFGMPQHHMKRLRIPGLYRTASAGLPMARGAHTLFVWAFGLILVTGCGGPAYLAQPDFDAAAIGRALLDAYDADSDGLLSEAELKKCPSVLEGLKRFDSGGDRQVSPEEIAARVGVWSKGRVAVMRFEPRVLLDGKPLGDALVELDSCKPPTQARRQRR